MKKAKVQSLDPQVSKLLELIQSAGSSTESDNQPFQQISQLALDLNDKLQDLTLQNQRLETLATQAEEGARIKSEFLATMSHEIRTPMNGVLGVVDMMIDDQLPASAQENLKIIQTSSQNLLTIINDILDFSKIEAGKLDIESYPIDLVHTIETCINIFKFKAQDKGIELLYDIDPNIQGHVITDGSRLSQIINNLISNAIKFTQEGHVLLRARLKGGMGANRIIQFSVLDTGLGIPDEQQSKLFTSFTQADSSTSRKYGGTGLGLAISKRLAELLGGSIGLRSKVAKGTEFYFTIQCQIEPTLSMVSEKLLFSGHKVIYLDHSKVLGSSFKSICSRWSLSTKVIKDPETIFTLLDKDPQHSAIFVDYRVLKSIDIHKIHQRLIGKYPNKYPIVLTSSLLNLTLVEDKSYYSNILPKPFNMEAIKEVLCSVTGVDYIELEKPIDDPEKRDIGVLKVPDCLTPEELGLKILIAEDNTINQRIIKKMFSKIGMEVDIAQDGLEALSMSAEQDYDLIFMDMQMPHMDGIEATEILVKRQSFNSRPLIIAMTANAMQSDRELCLGVGMDDFMTKPLKVDDIKLIIRKWNPSFGITTPINPQG